MKKTTQIEHTNNVEQPVYPILISEDKEGFETSIRRFISAVKQSIVGIKPIYDTMKLDEPFDDNTWKLICHGSNILTERYANKLKAVSDLLGGVHGLEIESIVTKNHPAIGEISTRLLNLRQHISMQVGQPKGHLRAEDVVNVNGDLQLSDDAYCNHLEAYRSYVKTAREATIKQALDKFAHEYKEFVHLLNLVNYGPHIGSIHNSYLNNFYTQTENGALETDPSAWGFLSNFNLNNI